MEYEKRKHNVDTRDLDELIEKLEVIASIGETKKESEERGDIRFIFNGTRRRFTISQYR